MTGKGKRGHSNAAKNAKVVVTLQNGDQFEDVFIRRPPNKRWIELKNHGRVSMELIKSVIRRRGQFVGGPKAVDAG